MQNIYRLGTLLVLLLAIGSTVFTGTARSQPTTEGREFWLGFMPNADLPAQQIQIIVATRTDNKVKVETYGEGGNIVRTQSVTLAAGAQHTFAMSVGLSETRQQEVAAYRAIRVTSTSPCTIIGYSDNNLSSEGFLALPLTTLGNEYYCASYYDDNYYFIGNTSHLGGEFLIVAPYDNTEVTITTTATTTTSEDGLTVGHQPGDTWKVTLQRGQTYLVQTTGRKWAVDDLTGSHVTSSKPIGFISGHQRAQIETTADNSKEHLIEMLPPVTQWGIEYIGVPQRGRLNGNFYRVLSAEDGNTIQMGDTTVTLNKGKWAALSNADEPVRFFSTNGKRFLTMEYAYHQGYNGDPASGDPFMVTLTPMNALVKRAIFAAPQNIGSSFAWTACLVSTDSGIARATLKEGHDLATPINSLGPTLYPIPGTKWIAAVFRFSGSAGTKVVESTEPFALHFYGNTQTESFAAPAARSFVGIIDSVRPTFEVVESDSCGNVVVKVRDDQGVADIFAIETPSVELYGTDRYTINHDFAIESSWVVGDTTVMFFARPKDARQDSYLAVYMSDLWGNDTVLELARKGESFSLRLNAPFPITRPGDTSCTTVTIRNDHIEALPFSTRQVKLPAIFRFSSLVDIVIAAGDSATFEVCFTPNETKIYIDTLSAYSDCADDAIQLRGQAAVPRINAGDHKFGHVAFGDSICHYIGILNEGDVPVTITDYKMVGDTVFNIITPLPITIPPGEAVSIVVCFTPSFDRDTFSAAIEWVTVPRATALKVGSIVTGNSGVLGVDVLQAERIRISPNPATTSITLDLPDDVRLTMVEAIDMRGVVHTIQAREEHRFDVGTLPVGVYMVRVVTDTGAIARPLVIKR